MEASLIHLLGFPSGGISFIEASTEATMPLLGSEGLISPFGEVDSTSTSLPVDLDFSDFSSTGNLVSTTKDLAPGSNSNMKPISFPNGSSARTNVIGNYLLSKKAKRRQRNNASKKTLGKFFYR